jgi:hypothetical protein
MSPSPRRYLTLFLVGAVVAGIGYRPLSRWIAANGCRDYAGINSFLAYCTAPSFGDYEHGAYYYGFEREAVDNLQRSQVLLLGNSRSQFAFSTESTRNAFARAGIREYLLGFGYDETSDFPRLLIEKYHLHPGALIIVADPFFMHGVSLAASPFESGATRDWQTKFLSWQDTLEKFLFTRTHHLLCNFPLVCQHNPSIYRSVSDGRWITHAVFDSTPSLMLEAEPQPAKKLSDVKEDDERIARSFFQSAGVEPSCVVLTAPPNAVTDADEYAAEIGRRLGTHVSIPRLSQMATIDHSHLDPASAERWSAAVLAESLPWIEKCVRGG